jgi:protein SCO1/2
MLSACPPRLRTRAARLAVIAALLLAPALGFSALSGGGRTASPLPVLGRVADFALVDQSSTPVSRTQLAGAAWVANFVFTRCPTTCPRLSDRMRAIQALAKQHAESLRLVTFTVDPEHDQPDVLRPYAEAYGADPASWKFLTGSQSSIEEIVRSFAVALSGKADPAKPDLGIMHSGHLVLVDRVGRIRGYYPSSEDGVEDRILADLKRIDVS